MKTENISLELRYSISVFEVKLHKHIEYILHKHIDVCSRKCHGKKMFEFNMNVPKQILYNILIKFLDLTAAAESLSNCQHQLLHCLKFLICDFFFHLDVFYIDLLSSSPLPPYL